MGNKRLLARSSYKREREVDREIGQASSVTQVVLADRSHISAFVLKPDPFSRPYPRHNWNTIERKREI